MKMRIRTEVLPFIGASLSLGVLLALGAHWARLRWSIGALCSLGIALVMCGYFLFFFRDPVRTPPPDDTLIVAGADGTIASVAEVYEGRYLKTACIRISIFLSLFDVHVNRAPIEGKATFLGYFPGKHFFTFREKSSEFNQHNKILIQGNYTRCLLSQIVGPVCRRVVYWPDHENPQPVTLGERIGMMKFGSRLDMTFPSEGLQVRVGLGQRVKPGETIVATITQT